MRRLLGSVLPALLLAVGPLVAVGGCGDEDGDAAQDPATSAPGTSDPSDPSDPSDGTVDFDLVDTITVTAAGGEVSETAVPLTDDTVVQQFLAQFEPGEMTDRLQAAVDGTDVPDGRLLYGAVVAIGCDSPTEVSVTTDGPDVVITALPVPSPKPECFAPMTTVALVLVPASAVG